MLSRAPEANSSSVFSGEVCLDKQFLLFATGILLLGCAGQVETGKPVEECRKQVFMLDSKGLVCNSRLHELQHHKINFAHDVGEMDYMHPGRTSGLSGTFFDGNHLFVWFASSESDYMVSLYVRPRYRQLPGRTCSTRVKENDAIQNERKDAIPQIAVVFALYLWGEV